MSAATYFVLLALTLAGLSNGWKQDPEEDMDPYQLISSKGYPVEEHEAVTADGYRLGMQRILRGRNEPATSSKPRPVVYLQHGLLASSTCWLTNLANESIAYILADAGYEVWLGNFRGNTYSRKHVNLSPTQHAFWMFSWDEMGKFDLEAMIDKALEVSGASGLYYVGHSEGTMTAFAKFSSDLEFGEKIKHFFALAPVHTVGHIGGLGHFAAKFTNLLKVLFGLFGQDEFLPSNEITKLLAKYLCGDKYTNPLCDNILFLIAGYDSVQLNRTRVPIYVAHTPAGTSVQNMVHFGQNVKSNKFQMYDYGSKRDNHAHYGQKTPPVYDVSKMKVRVSLFWGDKDILGDPVDVAELIGKLTSLANSYYYVGFNHLDFIWGMNAPSQVYNKIINTINANEAA